MIDEDKITRKASEELFKATQEIYNPEPSKETKMFNRKRQLQKEINEIEEYEHRNDAEIERQKKLRLRQAVKEHQREQQKINEAINTQSSQVSHVGKGGKLSYGY